MAKNKFADLLGEVGLGSVEPPGEGAPPPPPRVGKRSDPAYRQISTYVRSDLYRLVKRELLMDERDFSDLMDELLAEWVSRRQSK
ncbi:MAG TPA: hypothetical protein VEX68_00260 [Bryobacteraceae bacterium]|nr:hypothetical protein [Bryobacteraceae bacterium]